MLHNAYYQIEYSIILAIHITVIGLMLQSRVWTRVAQYYQCTDLKYQHDMFLSYGCTWEHAYVHEHSYGHEMLHAFDQKHIFGQTFYLNTK